MNWQFFLEVLVGGLLAGVMYSLVALGFVLIYKASGVFNFAQGAMVFFAALTFVSLVERGMNFWVAIVDHAGGDGGARDRDRAAGAAAAGQPAADHAVHGDDRPDLRAGGPRRSSSGARSRTASSSASPTCRCSGCRTTRASTSASSTCSRRSWPACSSPVLAVFFQTTRIGRALRAVADDHQAALAVGIPLRQIWAIVWTVAGFVALVAGLMWGARNGVQFALTFIALKALPVLILGGFESVAGRDRRRADHRRLREAGRGLPRAVRRRRDRVLVPVRAGARLPAGPARRAVRRKAHRAGVGETSRALSRSRPVQDHLRRATSRSFRSGRTASPSRVLLVVAFVVVPLVRQPVLAVGHPDAVPDPRAGHAGPEHPDRLRRPALARHRGVHGGGRVHGLQLRAAHAVDADPRVVRAGRPVRRRGRHRLRPAVAAHQGLLPRRRDARLPVLRAVGAAADRLVHQQQRLRRDHARRRS